MLYYDRNDISQRVDIHKTRSSKECDMCHSWYFLYINNLSFDQMTAMDVMMH